MTCSKKQCSKCREVFETSFFHKNSGRKDGLADRCQTCARKVASDHYKSNPDHRWRLEVKRKYGITAVQYYMMLDQQGGQCKICKESGPGGRGRTSRMAVDHCHSTGKVRGLLCNRCNRAIGLLGDNTDFLTAAIEYLSQD